MECQAGGRGGVPDRDRERLARRGVPANDPAIIVGGREQVAAELNASETAVALAPADSMTGSPGRYLPEARTRGPACRRDQHAIRAEPDGNDRCFVCHRAAPLASSHCVPEPECAVLAARGERGAIGTEREHRDRAVVTEGRGQWPAGRHVPEPRGVVLARRRQAMPVGAERHGMNLAAVTGHDRSISLDRACHEPRLDRTTRSRPGASAGKFSIARASQSIPSSCLSRPNRF